MEEKCRTSLSYLPGCGSKSGFDFAGKQRDPVYILGRHPFLCRDWVGGGGRVVHGRNDGGVDRAVIGGEVSGF